MKKVMFGLCGVWMAFAGAAAEIALPQMKLESAMTLRQAMQERRTTRDFAPVDPAKQVQLIADLLWCANGENRPGKRVIPAAIAKYAVNVYVADRTAVYRFDRVKNTLTKIQDGDCLNECAGNAVMCGKAAFALIFAVDENVWGKARKEYAAMEIGAMMQNVYLGCAALDLGTCACGSFNREKLPATLQLPANEAIALTMLVGGAAK